MTVIRWFNSTSKDTYETITLTRKRRDQWEGVSAGDIVRIHGPRGENHLAVVTDNKRCVNCLFSSDRLGSPLSGCFGFVGIQCRCVVPLEDFV